VLIVQCIREELASNAATLDTTLNHAQNLRSYATTVSNLDTNPMSAPNPRLFSLNSAMHAAELATFKPIVPVLEEFQLLAWEMEDAIPVVVLVTLPETAIRQLSKVCVRIIATLEDFKTDIMVVRMGRTFVSSVTNVADTTTLLETVKLVG